MGSQLAKSPIITGPNPAIAFGFDFISASEVSYFTATAVSTGTAAVNAADGGNLRISGAATTDDSGSNLQLPNCTLNPTTGSEYHMDGTITLSNVAMPFLFGFAITDTSLLASAPSDGVYLQKAKAGTALEVVVRRDSSEVKATVPGVTLAASTKYRLGLRVQFDNANPLTAIVTVTVNGDVLYNSTFANAPHDEILVPSIAINSGSATGTQTADIDWVRFSGTR